MKAPFPFLSPHECEKPYTVTEINEGIGFVLESENTLVWVEAEISNFRPSSAGHCYFKLKDTISQIPAVMWRSVVQAHPFKPADGMSVAAIASVRVYRKGGYYQLEVHKMRPLGIGALHSAFEKLKQRLQAEGLFDPDRKKPLPESVKTLGVITAKTGAALQDIIKVVSRRAPNTDIILRSVPVQGNDAPAEICAAIGEMNQHGLADCIILGRGGGSIEDLWAFNDENVVRAIYASAIPVISAVGHEIDFTLSDFAADIRAPTPSAAAEMAVADDRENRRYFEEVSRRFSADIHLFFIAARERFGAVIRDPAFKKILYRISESRMQCAMLHERAIRAVSYGLRNFRAMLSGNAAKLDALSPLAVLSRGFSIVSKSDGAVVSDVKQITAGENIQIRLNKGSAGARVISTDGG